MNSYFATAEQQDNPAWRGKVLGVCEHLGGIIIAASIEAKKWGIKTGTPVWEAKKIYPKIILTHTRAEAYRKYNRLLVKLVSDYTDKIEIASIDEVYLDLTKACNIRKVVSGELLVASNPFEEAVEIAKEIKQRMKTEVGDYLTCSVGIAENKLLAKIASDMQKPNGLTVIKNQELGIENQEKQYLEHALVVTMDELYKKLRLVDVPGIGRRMEKRLNALGIHTLLELKNFPQSLLVAAFGPIAGYHFYNMGQLRGSWKPAVHQENDIKSIGHMYTLPQEFRQPKFFVPVLYKLCEMVGRRIRKKNLSGNIIIFYVRGQNYESYGESEKLSFYTDDGREIFSQCMRIFQRLSIKPGEFKMIGITVAGLRPMQRQLSLFGTQERSARLTQALDKINSKYGDFTVCRVPILAAGKVFRDSIGFGRVKEM
ncbi:MAG: DNA polymerase IV [Candidatus Doudnabacteria bacterium]|nr:DNA polymerase IV [Candidatus Doudnabacteria bacterium]